MTCPDSDCHTKVNDTCKLVHSPKDGLPSKVSRKAMIGSIFAIASLLTGFTLYAMGSASTARTERTENAKSIEIIKTDYNHIRETMNEIKETQLTKGDIYKAIKRALKE